MSSSLTAVTESLGHISGQISSMQQCLISLTSTVDGLSSRTVDLTTRVAALEDIALEAQPAKKRKIDIPRDLSVSYYTLQNRAIYYSISFYLKTHIKRIYRQLQDDKKFHTNEK